MNTKLLGLIAACALLGSTVAADAVPYIVTLEEIGSNVVATGKGDIDLTGLILLGGGFEFPLVGPSDATLLTGGPAAVDVWEGTVSSLIVGPSDFGTGLLFPASVGAGAMVGVSRTAICSVICIVVPEGFVSGHHVVDIAAYDFATFASLGVTPGTYVWGWGTGADQTFTLEIGSTPLPAALPLFASGLGALGLLGWRRKRKMQAAA